MLRPITLCITILLATACMAESTDRNTPQAARQPGSPVQTADLKSTAADNLSLDLGLSLLRYVAKEEGGAQVLISPHGIASALVLAWNGSAGKTREGIASTIGLPVGTTFDQFNPTWASLNRSLTSTNADLQLANANSIWVRKGMQLAPPFMTRSRESFDAKIQTLDFEAAGAPGIINSWVQKATDDKIDSIITGPIPKSTQVYLINALYFKGAWTAPFKEEATRPRDFHPTNEPARQVKMMERLAEWGYHKGEIEIVRLPYGKGRFAMYVVLPSKENLEEWLKVLDGEAWLAAVSSLSMREGTVVLPRFRAAFSTKLKPALNALGMAAAFSDAADFSAMTTGSVAISEVVHKTFIEVDEKGSEAAAATGIEMGSTSVNLDPPFEFVADRPFFFAIRDDQSGALLFAGIVRSLPESL
ncbi:MAG: serpin family protein [Nitrospirota bacterium]|nr:serpin family protein [Nitrospirota bacterium]MDH5585238.1 serpin family protein [Nitrospirota bacterium]MDH5773987.1 serpin family protein [Nitrospirota bacterium]